MRRILVSAAVLLAVGAFVVISGGASGGDSNPTYNIQFDNAFGLVTGAPFKVAGVTAGTIKKLDLPAACVAGDPGACHAQVTVEVTRKGFGAFHSDAFCQSRPQSLIGEYFVDCQPGQSGPSLPSGSTIPASNTQSTIPADLVQNIMRLPYRQRFTLIVNELGAAVAARSEDLQTALRRADPALAQTDNLLNLLANDSHTIQQLNVNADAVITALADNSAQVQRFITEANNAATDTASQASSFEATWQKLPGFLEQLRPAMAKLGAAADANAPVLANLNAASGDLRRFFTDLVPFSSSSRVSLTCGENGSGSCPQGGLSLGSTAVTGKSALVAAQPTVAHLNQFAKPTPELAQNLAIILHDLDNRGRAVEKDPRSPGGLGYTGLEALLQYVFNQAVSINAYGPYGHMLTVDAFANSACSPYATPQTIADAFHSYQQGTSPIDPRTCYAWYGPNQIGVNTADPTNPGACVPDPGGAPPGRQGPATTACKLKPSPGPTPQVRQNSKPAPTASQPSSAVSGLGSALSNAVGGALSGLGGAGGSGPPVNIQKTLGQVLSQLGVGSNAPAPKVPQAPSAPSAPQAPSVPGSGSSSSSNSSSSNQAQQLLNYLLAP